MVEITGYEQNKKEAWAKITIKYYAGENIENITKAIQDFWKDNWNRRRASKEAKK